ncbi:hypothetical protein ATHSA_p10007 (plasmid) [Athalassotoga saccharophila]|uniref:Uncharacterized protein n=1 Tax=Athalassotoga saccharophila TaxID=1441386 RepID=A0A6N4TEZ6_9BACT|nr:hypothetical protein ATHSA_p10007 [Athalassotoga saccharophila]
MRINLSAKLYSLYTIIQKIKINLYTLDLERESGTGILEKGKTCLRQYNNTLEIMSTDLSMDKYVILGHYLQRENIDVPTTSGMNSDLGHLSCKQYDHACRRCSDMLYGMDGISILSQFQKPNRIKRFC